MCIIPAILWLQNAPSSTTIHRNGTTDFSSDEIQQLSGKKSPEIRKPTLRRSLDGKIGIERAHNFHRTVIN